MEVPPGVFHPKIYFSTPIFIEFLSNSDFSGKKILDIGTGSGALALFAAKNGATATAIDINPAAVETARKNAAANYLQLAVFQSNMFENLPPQWFDFILINPPFYPKNPKSASDHAFFAGENHEYFEKLFAHLPNFCHRETQVFMILSEDCDFEKIQNVAVGFGQNLAVIFQKKKWGERLFVAKINHIET